MALLSDMLLADSAPKNIIVCELTPGPTDLSGATERDGVEIAKDFECHLAREDGERVEADEQVQLFGKRRELGEAAHREDAFEDDFAPWMRRRAEGRPDQIDGFTVLKREGVK